MCRHDSSYGQRRETVLLCLNMIFSYSRLLPCSLSHLLQSEGINLLIDGHASGPAFVMGTIVEPENEIGSGAADPEIQLTSYQMLLCST